MTYFPIIQAIEGYIQKCKKEHSLHYWIWEVVTGVFLGLIVSFVLLGVTYWHTIVYIVILRAVWMIPVGIYEKRHGYKFSWLWN